MSRMRISPIRSLLSIVASFSFFLMSSCSEEQGPNPGSGEPSQTVPRPAPGPSKKGFKTDNPDHVISPFPPHNLIDISRNPKTGEPFQKGDFARDPSTGGIFEIP